MAKTYKQEQPSETKRFTFRANCVHMGKRFQRGWTYDLTKEEWANLKGSCYPEKEG